MISPASLTRILALASALACGCTPGDDAHRAFAAGRPKSLTVGEEVSSVTLNCHDGSTYAFGDATRSMLVTLIGNDVCETCDRHLSGIGTILNERLHGIGHVFVAYAPESQLAQLARTHAAPGRRVCLDTSGYLWQTYAIEQTPVSLVLNGARIMDLETRPLDSRSSQDVFVKRIERAARDTK